MLIPFDTLPATARIWIYQSTRKFSVEEVTMISQSATLFCEQWVAHGQPLKTSFKIERDHFLVLAVDEASADASGCSIDGSVRMLKEIQNQLEIDFFDRTKIAFLLENEVRLFPLTELKQAFTLGVLNSMSFTFNTLIATKGEMTNAWITPAGKTWLSKYLPKPAVA